MGLGLLGHGIVSFQEEYECWYLTCCSWFGILLLSQGSSCAGAVLVTARASQQECSCEGMLLCLHLWEVPDGIPSVRAGGFSVS